MITAEKLAEALYRLIIDHNGQWDEKAQRCTTPTAWFIVDSATAEPEVNWPGELISEHDTLEAARLGYAKACIDFATRAPSEGAQKGQDL
jgi:hypothetical protein